MPDYDPRTATGIPTEPVGSLPRPSRLQEAYAQYDAGEITREQLETEQDNAVRDSIEHQERFVGRFIERFRRHAPDLAQLLDEVALGLQPARGIRDDDI